MAILNAQSTVSGSSNPNASARIIYSGRQWQAISNPIQSISAIQGSLAFREGYYHNYLSGLARLFGINARQDETKLYISKSDLLGLTARVNNSAESLFVALLLQIVRQSTDPLIAKIFISIFKTELIISRQQSVKNTILDVKFNSLVTYSDIYEIDDSPSIDPNNF